jgi:hypothetical protein
MIFDLADLDGFHKSHLRFLSQQTGHLSTVIKKFFFQLHHVQLGMLNKQDGFGLLLVKTGTWKNNMEIKTLKHPFFIYAAKRKKPLLPSSSVISFLYFKIWVYFTNLH